MNELIVCDECGFRFLNNPNKHRFRPKYCPKCRHAYKHSNLKWKPKLNWIRSKIAKIKERMNRREQGIRERAFKSLRSSLRRNPTSFELEQEVLRRKIERGLVKENEIPKLTKKEAQ